MSADDIDMNNIFVNPYLYQAKLLDARQFFGFNYEDMASIYSSENSPYGSGFYLSQTSNPSYNGVSMWEQSYWQGQAPQRTGNSAFFRFDGGVPYTNNDFFSSRSAWNTSYYRQFPQPTGQTQQTSQQEGGTTSQSITQASASNPPQEPFVQLYPLQGSSQSTNGYSYNLERNGNVTFRNPKGEVITYEEFKNGVGSDFDRFKNIINHEGIIRGFGEVVS